MQPTLQRLKLCAALSALAYEPHIAARYRAELELHGLELAGFIHDASTDTEGFIAANAEEIFVAFRGTTTIQDWMTDAKVRTESPMWWRVNGDSITPSEGLKRARVHRGFLDCLWRVNSSTRHTLQRLRSVDQQLVITGHSLGGALAMLLALDLEDLFEPVNQVITFGQPRAGDAAFARYYNSLLIAKTFRVVNDLDAITRLPSWFMGYRHAGTELFIDCWDRLNVAPCLAYKLLSDVCSFFLHLEERRLGMATDHFMGRYISALNTLRGAGATGESGNSPHQDSGSPSASHFSNHQGDAR